MLNATAPTSSTRRPAHRYRKKFAAAAIELLENRLQRAPLDGRKFQIVSTVSDFELIALPIIRLLEGRGAVVRPACFWVATKLLDDNRTAPQEIAPIKAVIRDELDAGPYELIIAASLVGTIAELKAMAAHALYDQEHTDIEVDAITVISPLVHVDAERQFKDCVPERFTESVHWFSKRKDPELRNDGVLLPGVGLKPFEVAGFSSLEDTFHYIPSALISAPQLQKQRNPGFRPTI